MQAFNKTKANATTKMSHFLCDTNKRTFYCHVYHFSLHLLSSRCPSVTTIIILLILLLLQRLVIKTIMILFHFIHRIEGQLRGDNGGQTAIVVVIHRRKGLCGCVFAGPTAAIAHGRRVGRAGDVVSRERVVLLEVTGANVVVGEENA